MATMSLVRVDSRLIHGQVMAKWRKVTNADHILVIDDDLSKDPFMSKVYAMAAPPGTSVTIVATDAAVRLVKAGELPSGRFIILFKSVPVALAAWEKGFPIDNLQIGGLGAGPGRKPVFESISIGADDVVRLETIVT